MAKLVGSLRNDVEFQMIAFSTDPRVWKGSKLVKATAKNKEKAQKWLAKYEAPPIDAALAATDAVVGDYFFFRRRKGVSKVHGPLSMGHDDSVAPHSP